jgi:hypothetical protein
LQRLDVHWQLVEALIALGLGKNRPGGQQHDRNDDNDDAEEGEEDDYEMCERVSATCADSRDRQTSCCPHACPRATSSHRNQELQRFSYPLLLCSDGTRIRRSTTRFLPCQAMFCCLSACCRSSRQTRAL